MNKKEIKLHPLVKELYEKVPEYTKIADRSFDEFGTVPFGMLSLVLFDQIMNNESPTELVKSSFRFFNELGDRNDPETENTLIVEIYEGLYSKKKCNDTARELLNDNNWKVYQYWMINGTIRAES